VKGSGSWVETDTTLTQMGLDFDTSYNQDIYSILAGGDFKPGGDDSPYRLGLFGGYITSSLDFAGGLPGSGVDYEGGTVGGYAAYNTGAFYVDATVKGDILDATYDMGGGTEVDTNLWSAGVAANTGYRMTMGMGYVEPIASVSYVHTEVDNFTGGGGTVSFSNGESLRAGGGARIGAIMPTNGGSVEVSLLGKLWNEFEGDNTITATDGVTTETFTDDTSGLIGEAEATVGWTNATGSLSTFLSGGGKFGENFTSWNAQAGVRVGF
jgi:outer membrane autotransporter protein